ncbi:MAG: N-acetylmuramoyl-L-alanine amidase [Bdellovibrionales bacterium]
MSNHDEDISRRKLLRLMGLSAAMSMMPLSSLLAKEALPDVTTYAITTKTPPIPRPARKPSPPRILMIDAGHGGKDPGAIGRRGTKEKDVVLDISRYLADKLNGVRGIQVKLTRDSDEFIPLKERVKITQESRADLFISIHADSAPDHSARGLSAYTLSQKASDAFAKAIAEQENIADLMGGVPLDSTDESVTAILYDLAARHTKNASLQAKTTLIKKVGREWPLLDNPMRSANFAVLRTPDVPSVLLETGFLSNRKDEDTLRTRANRQKIAQLLARELATILNNAPFV